MTELAAATGMAGGSRHSLLLPVALAGVTLTALLLAVMWSRAPATPDATEVVTIQSGSFAYRAAGEFLRDGTAIDAPAETTTVDRLVIMKHQVSRAEYDRCVNARACRPLDEARASDAASYPAVGLSWGDATTYAVWLSRETGHRYRLPTDTEWAYAAGTAYRGDVLAGDGDAANPAKRWIAAYENESATAPLDPTPLPLGSFGTNANGLQDMSGNVWEWTSTCFVRHATNATGPATAVESCGVRTVEGRHRTYLSDFIRNPRGGACSVGVPPANLGVRLVRDDG